LFLTIVLIGLYKFNELIKINYHFVLKSCIIVSLTGAVAFKKLSRVYIRWVRSCGPLCGYFNLNISIYNLLDCKTYKSNRAEMRYNEQRNFVWNNYRSTNKRYSRDNRLITLIYSTIRRGLAPRCRLIASRWSIS